MAKGLASYALTTTPTKVQTRGHFVYGCDVKADADNTGPVFVSFDPAVTAARGPGTWRLLAGELLPIPPELLNDGEPEVYAVVSTGVTAGVSVLSK